MPELDEITLAEQAHYTARELVVKLLQSNRVREDVLAIEFA